jgi:hypothetical protein
LKPTVCSDRSYPLLPAVPIPESEFLPKTRQLGSSSEIITDKIDNALIALAVPTIWNKGLILHCHGHRPIGLPLQNDLELDDPFWSVLLEEGWMVGMTSYRREGAVVRDAITDVNSLHDYVKEKFGNPDVTLLEGRSMGGCIVTHLCELYPERYLGAVAIGAALLVNMDGVHEEPIHLRQYPQRPLLYLTNVSETGIIASYIEKAQEKLYKGDHDVVVPALWEINREGHDCVTTDERLSAMRTLICWVREQMLIDEVYIDATKEIPIHPSSVRFEESEYQGKIRRKISAIGYVTRFTLYGLFVINFNESDLNHLGITQGKKFELKFMKQSGHNIVVKFSTFPFVDVPKGDWVASIEVKDGHVKIGRNTYDFANPVKELGIEVGDEVFISLFQPMVKKLSRNLDL